MLFGYTLRYSQLKHKKSVAELVVGSRTIYVSGYILRSDPAAASCSYTGIYCINFCLIIVVRENDLSGQTYLYKTIYRHSQILANTPNIMGTLRSAECPRNIECITSSNFFFTRNGLLQTTRRKIADCKISPRNEKKNWFFYLSRTVLTFHFHQQFSYMYLSVSNNHVFIVFNLVKETIDLEKHNNPIVV